VTPRTAPAASEFSSLTLLSSCRRPEDRVVTEGIDRVTPDRIVTVHGTERALDAIVLATGLPCHRLVHLYRHQGCQRRGSSDRWTREVLWHTEASRMPTCDLFFLLGPNTGSTQLRRVHDRVPDPYVSRRSRWLTSGWSTGTRAYQGRADRFNEKLQRDLAGTCGTPAGPAAVSRRTRRQPAYGRGDT